MEKVTIIGGGVAGLSCLNALLDQGESPLLLEEKKIGIPKVCGEFLAPAASLQLQKWDIGPIQSINKVIFFANNKESHLTFSDPAGGFSRMEAELSLAKRAYEQGGRIHEHCRIKQIDPPVNGSPYIVHLDSGEQIVTQTVIMATGKLHQNNSKMVSFPYQGFKIHIPHVFKPETLFMNHYPGAYFGIVPISSEMSNLTCLAQKKVIDRWGSCKTFFHHLITINPLLADIDMSTIEWLEGKAPEFQAQKVPDWKNAFWIGDALASFYPAIGYGFAHGVNSAMCAAHFYLNGDAKGYTSFIKNDIKTKLWMGKLMHHSLMNPLLSNFLLYIIHSNPKITQFFMHKSGYH